MTFPLEIDIWGFEWNILTASWWIAMEFGPDVHVLLRMNYNLVWWALEYSSSAIIRLKKTRILKLVYDQIHNFLIQTADVDVLGLGHLYSCYNKLACSLEHHLFCSAHQTTEENVPKCNGNRQKHWSQWRKKKKTCRRQKHINVRYVWTDKKQTFIYTYIIIYLHIFQC